MDDNFSSLLDKPLDSFKKPKSIPEGTFLFKVKDFKFETQKSDKAGYVEYTMIPYQAMPDVDEDALAEMLDGNELTSKSVKKKFFITADALYRLTEFATHCGKDPTGKSVTDVAQSLPGSDVQGHVKHSIGQRDPSMIFAEIDVTAPVAEV